jgi:hypothetical protein
VSDYRLLGASSYIGVFFTFQDENSQKERYDVDMWLAFFFFDLCSQSILDFRFVPLFLKQKNNKTIIVVKGPLPPSREGRGATF